MEVFKGLLNPTDVTNAFFNTGAPGSLFDWRNAQQYIITQGSATVSTGPAPTRVRPMFSLNFAHNDEVNYAFIPEESAPTEAFEDFSISLFIKTTGNLASSDRSLIVYSYDTTLSPGSNDIFWRINTDGVETQYFFNDDSVNIKHPSNK